MDYDSLFPCPNPEHWTWIGNFYIYRRWASIHWAEKPLDKEGLRHIWFQIEFLTTDLGPRLGIICWKLKLVFGRLK